MTSTTERKPHVGDSRFESWLSEYDMKGKGTKQQMRDAYAAGMGDPLARPDPVEAQPERDDGLFSSSVMHACPTCGNKRCPHAADLQNPCTNSNEPGQPGSNYPKVQT